MKRRKRLQKGIESLQKQIELHEEKMKTAGEEGNIELEGYYQKEIEAKKKDKERKEELLDKQYFLHHFDAENNPPFILITLQKIVQKYTGNTYSL